ncbi:MAG TPA: hypothetical protein VGE74_01860 [Gemmata sp.]
MFTAFRALAPFAAIVALVVSVGLPSAPALQKDKDKKGEEKKGTNKKDGEVGTVEVWKAPDGWRFRVLNAAGKPVAGGYVPHEKKEDALKEVELLKATFAKGKVEVKEDKK